MNSQLVRGVLAGIAVVGVACIDMSAPKGPASISKLLLPSPSVVAGDVMRDSNGLPAPIGLTAYDASGSPIEGLELQFFFTDSVRYAHLSSDNTLTGDSVGIAHIVGQIGSVQTDVTPVPVTSRPDTLFIALAPDTLRVPLGVDSVSSLGTSSLGVVVRGAGQEPVAGFVVRYVLVRAPETTTPAGTSPAVFIIGDNGKMSLVDTTDASGNASRTLVVNGRRLADSQLIAGLTVDSAVVRATVSYKGVPVPGSPITFVVPIKGS